ncbi:XkdX family protein [Brevibacillus porteri]|uniref:XkdX family protein n=1 Tax=Brevibacillus porteri TaxID=2126350 RepID=UPI003D220B61
MPGGFSICLQYRFGEYTAEDVTRFVEQGKLTPEQYEGITGEKYDASVVEQQETVQ